MTSLTAVDVAMTNYRDVINEALAWLQNDPSNVDLLLSVSRAYRRLAIASLLGEVDVEAFCVALEKAAQVYVELLQATAETGVAAPQRRGSHADAFSDALACARLDLASRIAQLAPSAHLEGYEYEDDFLRVRSLMSMLLDAPEVPRLLDRWEEVMQGGSNVFFAVTTALHERDGEAWEEAFDALIARRAEVMGTWRGLLGYDPDVDATEGQVFVEALALLRLAEMRGIPTRRDYRFVPDIARVPLGRPALPAGAWRSL